jgi:hypothetical protein
MNIKTFTYDEKDLIYADKFAKFAEADPAICYIKTDFFVHRAQFMWRNKLHPTRFLPNVITGHSDYPMIDAYVVKTTAVKNWFVQNNFTTASNVYSVPLGLMNDVQEYNCAHIHSNKKPFVEMSKKEKAPTRLAYMNFNPATYPTERVRVFEMFKDTPWLTVGSYNFSSNDARQKYIEETYDHKFSICPRGNGLDTHRLWEALYLRTIPIVIYHNHFKDMQDLPILFINDWSEVTEEFLNSKWEEMSTKEWNFDKLKMSWWENFIRSKV